MRSLGSRGARIRLFENTKGVYYRDVWVAGRGTSRRSLCTCDRAEADRLGKQLLASLLRHEEVAAAGVVTLRYLWERYSTESPAFLDNTARTRTEEEAHAEILLAFFGDGCDVGNLTEADVVAFTAARLKGGIVLKDGESTRAVRARSPEVEVRILKTMLNWATTIRLRSGERLLASNPLTSVRGAREANPKRPVVSWEWFQATRKAMQELATLSVENPSKHQRWIRLELALVLAEATGRRIGSIRKLAWQDFDFERLTILWKAENDKKRKEWRVPMPPALAEEVTRFHVSLGGAFGGLVFPSATDLTKPLGREVFQHGLLEAERHAKIQKLDGGGWHALRRKWASERKHLPLVDVAAAGGWKDTQTLVECYQHADAETMLAVMSEPRKVSERAAGT
ncbi:MAG: tyrosine-type recombinase/integrase [Gemmatimonadaceae bacterium]